jgi:CRP-like cAMP-binding protein
LQIHQQREERAHLQQLIERSAFGHSLGSAEESTIAGLWRTAQHHAANSPMPLDATPRLITGGWAGWLRRTDDGRRLIFLFLMPGDFIIPGLLTVHACELISLTPVRTVDATVLVQDGGASCPRAFDLIQQSGLRYRRLLMDHLTRLTIGSTTSSIALLLTEFHERSLRSGACLEGRFSLPIGQRVLASALGRSAVQVNKVMSKLQADGIIRVGYDWIQIVDPQALRHLTGMSKGHAELQPAETLADHGLAGTGPLIREKMA